MVNAPANILKDNGMKLRISGMFVFLVLLSASIAFLLSCHNSRNAKTSAERSYDNTKIVYFVEYFNADTVKIMAGRKEITALVTTNALTGEGRSFILKAKKIIININSDTAFKIDGFDTSFNNIVINKVEERFTVHKAKDTVLTSW
ncbi:hypothetical protein [Paraflavitalea sp. CAU 1676]|uniref:hypothetical protein n=1 Tax=Paraflavitalea sp. CAU 1676 TaxID=3032598 RepID=UPI0023DA5F11|nr:hypothetical protein [Paraflavitalea sp. CAU 1676]MDF2191608.1 hypothetical protein [Paraflavitalea sp. CAU 1676]